MVDLDQSCQEMLADSKESVSSLPSLTEAERQQVLNDWNKTHKYYPKHLCVQDLFEGQAAQTPDAIALVFEGKEVTYRELNERASQIAADLCGMGVGPDQLVGVCLNRSAEMVPALLGILKAGGAYVPLDPQFPADRLSLMLEDSELKILLTDRELSSKFPHFRGQIYFIESKTSGKDLNHISRSAAPHHLAYVIYTSGSTGKPKGVRIPHSALTNFLCSMRVEPGLASTDILLAVTTISFDIAALELYLPLIVGSRLVIAPRETTADGFRLRDLITRTRPTVMQATPATWRLLLETGWAGSKELRILCGGEALTRDLADELLKRSACLWNMYGPTETTVWSTISRIGSDQAAISIGRPIANTEIYILGPEMQPVPVGIAGELYIGGAGLAQGYFNRSELTNEKFISHPFRNGASGDRLYKTGDLARYLSDGSIECLGRIDSQVKIRGFRIELGEIETVLGRFDDIKQGVVLAQEGGLGDRVLVAHLVADVGKAVDFGRLREFLKQHLPDYMLPSRFELLSSFPLTPNGKIDRQALAGRQAAKSDLPHAEVTTNNETESELLKIWKSVLRVGGIRVNDNFFELGGHSLLAAKLLRQIEATFGERLSLAALFEAPTVETQARLIGVKTGAHGPSALIPVQRSGSRTPFFCFGFSAGPLFLPLAKQFGCERPLLCVDPTLVDLKKSQHKVSMQDIARSLAQDIRARCPNGPYYFGGFCGGGLIAYATANHLVGEGEEVPLLALFEPRPSWPSWQANRTKTRGVGRRLALHRENFQQLLQTGQARAYVHDRVGDRIRVYSRQLETTFIKIRKRMRNTSVACCTENIEEVLENAYRDYDPEPFPGRLALFQASHRETDDDWERRYWAALASNFEVHEVPGFSNWVVRFFLEPGNVEFMARTLGGYLP